MWQEWQVNSDPSRFKFRTEHWDKCQYIYEAEFLYSHDLIWLASDALEARDAAVRERTDQLAAFLSAISTVSGWYPESVFPEDGESIDSKSASMARITCENVKREFLRLIEKDQTP